MRSLAILALPLLLAACGGAGPALSLAVIAADALSSSVSGKNPFVYDDPPRANETVGPAGHEPSADALRSTARPGTAGRYLVLGTYADRSESRRAVIRGRQFLPVITRLEDGDRLVYRVVAGPFAADDAESMRRRLASAGFKDAWPISLCSDTFRTPPCRASSEGIDVASLPRSERRFLRP